MDKKTLLLLSFCLLPGIGMLLTFYMPSFNIEGDSTFFMSSLTFRVLFTFFSCAIGLSSLIYLVFFGKNLPIDNLYNIRSEKRKKSTTDFIIKYLNKNNINTYSEEDVRKFVDDNYDDLIKEI